MKRSLYDIVGVPPVAPREMIASACRRRIAQLERQADEAARTEIFAVREAWSILGDEKLRAGYDATLATADSAPDDATKAALIASEIALTDLAVEVSKPRHLLAENWERYRKLVYAMLIVGLFAISAVYNHSRRVAHDMRLEAANYEAEHGEPPPHLRKPAPVDAAKPAEPFSAEKFEKELKEREAEIQEQVAREQTAKEDEFRDKMSRETGTGQTRRRTRER